MKCFNHQTKDSVGVCRLCGKAVCPECAVSFPLGLVCRGACEKRMPELMAQVEGQKRRIVRLKKFQGWFILCLGIAFAVLSFFIGGAPFAHYMMLGLGLFLIITAVVLFWVNRNQ